MAAKEIGLRVLKHEPEDLIFRVTERKFLLKGNFEKMSQILSKIPNSTEVSIDKKHIATIVFHFCGIWTDLFLTSLNIKNKKLKNKDIKVNQGQENLI